MLQILGQGGVLTLAAIGLLAWGFARVLDAPRWSGRAILLALVLVALAGLLLLPPEAPFRQSVQGTVRFALVAGIVAVPVLVYRRGLRRLRARRAPAAAPAGITGHTVLVDETRALAADLDAALDSAPPQRLGLVHRAADGGLLAGAAVTLTGSRATLAPLWWDEAADSAEVVAPLLDAAAAEARRRGAHLLAAETGLPRIARALIAQGFTRTETGPPQRLIRELP
ncbi:hypothetical protein GE300_22385 [Rhodobacteraceae bacterium 2CG4]|uniref:Uncharacterized protein n=1 Tax=Halovulum marinum TaxID=2662447 RepID=A0A6L5Z6U7_9RHOB|nr:hypothetical protein [Halovulum marinum]MSU92281.1 hypothetical protein [Halovulum marinum]